LALIGIIYELVPRLKKVSTNSFRGMAFLVDDNLKERENKRYEMKINNSDDDKIGVKYFYSARSELAWIGVFNDWDCRREIYEALWEKVVNYKFGEEGLPAASIIGRGGSGKSIVLRRLGIDLFNQGYEVWYAEDAKSFLDNDISKFIKADQVDRLFILLDEAQQLKSDEFKRLAVYLRESTSITCVIAGQSIEQGVWDRLKKSGRGFDLSRLKDQGKILAKIAELIPEWNKAIVRLSLLRGIDKARVIHLVYVLSKGESPPTSLQELETKFLEVIAADYKRLHNEYSGLARAILFAAQMHQIRHDISRAGLVAMADHHEKGSSLLLDALEENVAWKEAEDFITIDQIDKVRFNHQEIAANLINAGQGGYLLHGKIDDHWLLRDCHAFMSSNNVTHEMRSSALFSLVNAKKLNAKRANEFIDKLISDGNCHDEYLKLFSTKANYLGLTQEVKAEKLWKLWECGCNSIEILEPLFEYTYGSSESEKKINKDSIEKYLRNFLDSSFNAETIARALKLLKDKDKALSLLKIDVNPLVLVQCLKLLGIEYLQTQKFAIELIKSNQWQSINPPLLVQCIRVSNGHPEFYEIVFEILRDFDQFSTDIQISALRFPHDTEIRKIRASEILSKWKKCPPNLVAAALSVYWDDPIRAQNICKDILINLETKLRNKSFDFKGSWYHGHIVKALSHPELRSLGKRIAYEMLAKERMSQGFLPEDLHKWVISIIEENKWPIWSG